MRARIDVLQPLPGLQRGDPSHQDDVVAEGRTILDAAAVVDADALTDAPLKEQRLEGRGVDEPQVAHVRKSTQLRRQLDVEPAVDEHYAGVDEIRLSFVLVGPQR